MHTCMIAIGLTAQHRLSNMQAFCRRVSVIVCAYRCQSFVHPYIQLSACQSVIPCFAFFILFNYICFICLSIFIQGCVETFGWLSQNWATSVHSHTHAMYNPTEISPTRQHRGMWQRHVRAYENKRVESCKTQRWCLGSPSPGLTVSENIFNYSTWQIEKPKTEQRPFNV